VKRIVKRDRETGTVEGDLHRVGRRALIDGAGEATLRDVMAEKPDATLRERQSHDNAIHGIQPVLAVFHRVLKSLKLTYKKQSLFAAQQLREDVKKKRSMYCLDENLYARRPHCIR
jgi:transposase